MNIGIFVTALRPRSPSQARLQEAIFAGLEKAAGGRYRFVVLSNDAAMPESHGAFRYETLAIRGPWAQAARNLGAACARALAWLWRAAGASGGRMHDRLAIWRTVEPAHYDQLRAMDIRLLWNMHQHSIATPTPFIRTVWEANHRIHSMYPEYSYARYGFDALDDRMGDSLARASYVITGTEEGRRQVVQMFGVHDSKIRVIPFPTPVLPETDALPPGERYILYPSRFWPHKNHVVILEALKLLREEHGTDLRCVLTGGDGGNLDYVLRYADRLGVRDLVEYRGEVSEAELAALYRGAWALTYASAVGPDNLPPLEAMSLDCAVITADVPGAREQYGEAALFFDPMGEATLARQLLDLAKKPALRETLIERGRQRAKELTANRYGVAMVAIFDEFARIARSWERNDSAFI